MLGGSRWIGGEGIGEGGGEVGRYGDVEFGMGYEVGFCGVVGWGLLLGVMVGLCWVVVWLSVVGRGVDMMV